MSDLDKLIKDVESLLRQSGEHGIIIDGFWQYFEKSYGYKPVPRKFGKSSLITLFDLFPNVEKVEKNHHIKRKRKALYICLRDKSSANRIQEKSQNSSRSSSKLREKEPKKPERKDIPDKVKGNSSAATSAIQQFKEMNPRGFIFHTYGRELGGEGISSGERGQQSTQHQERSREQQSQLATNTVPGSLLGVPGLYSGAPYEMMPAMAASTSAQPTTPLVYGMKFPSLSDVSAMLAQGQSASGKGAKKSRKEQDSKVSESSAFLSLDSVAERSLIATPPPPRQYQEPPSARAIADAATSEAEDRDRGNARRSRHSSHQYSQSGSSSHSVFASKQELESVAADCIDRLSEADEYVSIERIEKLLLRHYNVSSLSALNVRRVEHIKCVGDLIRVECKVNAYVQSFCKTRSLCTLHELHLSLQDFCANSQPFETLKLGPLKNLPIIWEYFKFPVDNPILEIDTKDIFESLRGFLSEKNLWQSRDLKKELEPFLMYMVEQHGVANPYCLGVRFTSVLLAVQVLKRAQRDASNAIKNACERFKDLAQADIATAFRSFTSGFLEKETGMCTVRENLLCQDAAQVFGAIFAKLIMLYDSINYSPFMETNTVPGMRRDWNKTRDIINEFHRRMTKDKFLKKIFHFCICMSAEQIHEQLQDIMGWNPNALSEAGEESSVERPIPNHADVVKSIKKYLERCIMREALNLAHLGKIENKLLEEFNFPNFFAMGQKHFIDFLLASDDIKKFLEESGGGLMGLSSASSATESSYHPGPHDILDFVRQCSLTEPTQTVELEEAMCTHYKVSEVKSLGHGSVQTLLSKQIRGSPRDSSVIYETAVCAKARIPSVKQRKVGVMGSQSKERALACLENCPLLEDLAEWTHWDLVFKPELGPLKDFVQKYGGTQTHTVPGHSGKMQMRTSFLALETSPGILLKISANTSNDKFARAAASANVSELCGHLTSLIVLNKGPEKTPLALLGNHVQTALLKMSADESSDVPGAPTGRDKLQYGVMFVLGCLTYLPFVICQSVANKVFLEPLSQAVGATKSKELLINYSRSNVKMHGRLQLLGSMLGIDEWARTFETRIAVPDECITKPEKLEAIGFAENEIIELDSSDEMLEDSDSDDDNDSFTLSDDSDDEVMDIKLEPGTSIPKAETENNEGDESEAKQSLEKEDVIEIKDDTDSVKTVATSEDSSEMEIQEEPTNPQQALIEEIRKDEFGINVELSEDGRKLMDKQKERLGRSLDRLSKDLYSKDTHFVLELIQNADDNDYPEEVVSSNSGPSVKFVVEDKCITVMNNESGFKEKNIRAICDVGKSTKGKHKFGYIGQKGIGFKSVFRITDLPEIHSNNYHLRFDVKSDPMGYILPHWHPDSSEKSTSDRWTTKIVLPLKEDMQSSAHASSLAARFQDVHPSLLLFLHRLKAIQVVNKVEDNTLKMHRRDIGQNVIEIRHSKGLDRWLVVKKTLDASHISSKAKSGVDVESTEIALAFPLQSKEKVQTQVLPQKQPVFAFLPLRSYGFRFVIQGDFDVPSSREDVDRDSMWNQWLVSEIHTLFVESLETFKAYPDFSVFDAVCNFLQFIPLEDEIIEFFRTVASQILQQMRGKPCLPTVPNKSGKVEWKLPSQLLLNTDPLVREVVNCHVLQQHLSLMYLHEKVALSANVALLKSLGVQMLNTQHLIEVAKGIIQTGGLVNADVTMIAKWWACVYRSMDELQSNEELRADIRRLEILPVVDGSIVSLEQCSVFFPLDQEERRKKLQKGKDPILALERDLNTVHPLLLNTDDQIANSQVARLLEQLGVKKLTPSDVIKHHILPTLREEHLWKGKSEDLLVAYMVYIKEQLGRQPSLIDLEEFRKLAILRTNRGMLKPSDASIHFSVKYNNNTVGLENNLLGYPWTLVDDCYIAGLFNQSQIDAWRSFFTKLGVLDFLAVEEKLVTFNIDQIERTPWSAYKDLIQTSAKSVQVKDFCCPEFEALVKSNLSPESMILQMKFLFQTLERYWKDKYARYVTTQMLDESGNLIHDVESSFAMNLKNFKWLPGIQTLCTSDTNGKVISQQQTVLDVPSHMFVKAPVMEMMLAHHVTYLNAHISSQSDLGTYLGIKQVIDQAFIRDCLIKWSSRSADNPDEPARFITSLRHIKDIYRFLHHNMTPKDQRDLLHKHNVIFTCTPDNTNNQDTLIEGKFLGRDNVRWHDHTGLFGKYKNSLADHQMTNLCRFNLRGIYLDPDMEGFFIHSARIDNQPTLPEIFALLKHIVNTNTVQKALADVLQIFSIIGTKLIGNEHTSRVELDLTKGRIKDQLHKLREIEIIPTKKSEWVSVASHPMIADDKGLERLFQTNQEVAFVDTGDKLKRSTGQKRQVKLQVHEAKHDPESVAEFLVVCGVKKLTECVRTDYITESFQPCAPLQQYVHDVVPYVQKELYNSHVDVYEHLTTMGIKEILCNMLFGSVGKLDIVYELRHKPDIMAKLPEKCKLKDNSEFYVQKDHVDHLNIKNTAFNDVNKELAKFFSQGSQECFNDLRTFLLEIMELVLNRSRELEDLEYRFLNKFSPDDEWHVKEPVWYKPPTPPPPPLPVVEEPMEVDRAALSQAAAGDNGDGNFVKAWPPASLALDNPDANKRSSAKSMWPPPEPPMKIDTTLLPDNLRPARPDLPGRPRTPREHEPEGLDFHRNDTHRTSAEIRPILDSVPPREHRDSTFGASTGRRSPGAASVVREGHVQRSDQQEERSHHWANAPDVQIIDSPPKRVRHNDDGPRDVKVIGDTDDNSASEPRVTIIVPKEGQTGNVTEPSYNDGARSYENSEFKKPMPEQYRRSLSLILPKKRQRVESDSSFVEEPRRHQFVYDIPEWTADANDMAYEEMGVGSTLPIPKDMPLDGTRERLEVGRWGEMLVYNYLLQQQEASPESILKVEWVNEADETGSPYDLLVKILDPENPTEIIDIFIEVKTTKLDKKSFFEISTQEVKFAQEKQEFYHLYRVFNAGDASRVRLTRLENLAQKMDSKQVKLCLAV